MKAVLIAAVLVALASPAFAADRVKVFIFAEPDPALGGLVSTALANSVEDLTGLMEREGKFRQVTVTNKRADATMLVQVTGRNMVNEEYRVTVHVTLPDGSTRELVGTDARQWKRCMIPLSAALRELVKAQ